MQHKLQKAKNINFGRQGASGGFSDSPLLLPKLSWALEVFSKGVSQIFSTGSAHSTTQSHLLLRPS